MTEPNPLRRPTTSSLQIGEAWCVTANHGGAVWRLTASGQQGLPLAGVAREAARAGLEVARGLAPWVLSPHDLFRDQVLHAAPAGGNNLAFSDIRGRSLGLAATLAHASRLAGTPAQPAWVAAAAVKPDGRLDTVRGWPDKLAALRALSWRPTLVVAERETFGGLPVDDLAVLRFDHARAAALAALATPPALPPTPAHRDRLARYLLTIALDGWRPGRPWAGLRATAELLASSGVDPATCAWITALADRYGQTTYTPALVAPALLPDDDLDAQAWLLAHRCEDAIHHPDLDPAPIIAAAVRLLTDSDATEPAALRGLPTHGEERRLLGALGRLLARVGRVDEAISLCLEPCRATWVRTGKGYESSHALAELLLLHGAAGTLPDAERWIVDLADDPRTSDASLQFARVALGRGLVLAGDLPRALRVLDDGEPPLPGGAIPQPGLEAQRLRWIGVADPSRRATCRAALDDLAPSPHVNRQRWLLDLEDNPAAPVPPESRARVERVLRLFQGDQPALATLRRHLLD